MNRRKFLKLLSCSIAAGAGGIVSGCGGSDARDTERALRFAITDVEGLEQLQREFGAFRDLLQAKTGTQIDLFPVADRTAAVSALENGQIDLVLTGPAEYVIFRSRTKVKPLVGLFRPEYTAVFLVREQDSIRSLPDIRGKKLAMGAICSTSKHLAPVSMLAEAGVSHTEFTPFHTSSVRAGWESLVRGDVAAFATTNDKYLLLKEEHPDAGVMLIAESQAQPMDVLLSSPGVPDAVTESIKSAIGSASEEFISAILTGDDNQKYRGMQFRLEISDRDYDDVRTMFRSAGLEQFATTAG